MFRLNSVFSRGYVAHSGTVFVARPVEAQYKGARFRVRVHPRHKRTDENGQRESMTGDMFTEPFLYKTIIWAQAVYGIRRLSLRLPKL